MRLRRVLQTWGKNSLCFLGATALAFLPAACGSLPHDIRPQAPPPATLVLPEQGGDLHPSAPPNSLTPPRTLARATLGATGDIMIQGAVKQSATAFGSGWPDAGYAWILAPVADLLSQPDIMFANLETPVAPGADRGSKEFQFNAPLAAAAALAHAGFDVVSVANNHAFDQGRSGFEETVRELGNAGLKVVGAGPSAHPAGPLVVSVNGLKLAFLGYAYGFNQTGNDCPPSSGSSSCLQASLLDRKRALEDVRAAASSGADAVIVSLHWGQEYAQQPKLEDVEFAHALADAGALVVLGHHPHVLQPVELYHRADGRTALIAYSLGNFLSNQSRKYVHGITPPDVGATRDEVLLRMAVERRDYGHGVVQVELAEADYVPLWMENDTSDIDPKREPHRRPALRVVAIDRAVAAIRAELSSFPDPVPSDRQDAWARLRKHEALLLDRRAANVGVVGEELVHDLTPAELRASENGGYFRPPRPQESVETVPSAVRASQPP